MNLRERMDISESTKVRAQLQNVLDSLTQMAPDQVPSLLGELEVIRATAMMRISAPAPQPQADSLIAVADAAERLGVSAQYLYRNHRKYPFARREGRKLLFSSAGLDRHIRQNRG